MTIYYGGDYNPEQWPRDVWAQDAQLMAEASMNLVTLGVFDWALLQRPDESYDFTVLDEVVDHAEAMGMRVCLATATGAHPAWMAHQYPDVTRVDFDGRKHVFGQRHNSCPSSPNYQRFARELARRIAERYGDRSSIVAWHIGNEYGGACYCENCASAFRLWLKERYGTLNELNRAWYTTFWSHQFTDWEHIVVPSALSEHWNGQRHTAFQGITLDYRRFQSDALLANYVAERDAIRSTGASQPATTNLMGLYGPLDYARWATEMDFVSWDNYPPGHDQQARMALTHDLMRGLKDGQPFWVMEQTPSTTACRDENPVKRPGIMRAWSYQSIAHGADAVLFFQIRMCRGASEKYHGAVIDHSGRSDTRVFREVAALGTELTGLGELVGARTESRVALLVDWPSWWAIDLSDGPSRHLDYRQLLIDYYTPWFERGVSIDAIGVDADFTRYDVVLAPGLHMVPESLAARIDAYVRSGGTFLASVLSGLVDEDDQAHLMVGPGVLAPVMGIRIDETDALTPSVCNRVRFTDGAHAEGRILFDIIALDGAQPIAEYLDDFYAHTPVVTRNDYGQGTGWYIGSVLDPDGMAAVVERIAAERGIELRTPDGVEVARRVTSDGSVFTFWINHSGQERNVEVGGGVDVLTGQSHVAGAGVRLAPAGVAIIRS